MKRGDAGMEGGGKNDDGDADSQDGKPVAVAVLNSSSEISKLPTVQKHPPNRSDIGYIGVDI